VEQFSVSNPDLPEPDVEWVGLALSGGGFRATLFHLGVVEALRKCGLLQKVKLISSVSGGSILAAHLILHWDQYAGESEEGFAKAANSIKDFAREDVRDRIIRRWLAGTLFVVPRLLGKLRFTTLFEKYLDELYVKATLKNLGDGIDRPEIQILATSLTTGELCKFTGKGFEIVNDARPVSIDSSMLPISRAVAASAAFPPFFPPVPIDHNLLKRNKENFPVAHVLTDGGVFDNLGIQELARVAKAQKKGKQLLIVSDAGGNFDWAIGKKYKFVLTRNVRANNIVMHRAGKLTLEAVEEVAKNDVPLCKVHIGSELKKEAEPTALDPEVQWAAKNMRTDLNACSENEIEMLIRHGYSETRAALRAAGYCMTRDETGGDDEQNGKSKAKQLRYEDTRRRRLTRLFAPFDWVTWLIVLWMALPLSPWGIAYLQHRLITEQKETILGMEENLPTIPGQILQRTYLIKVVDALSNRPLINAHVDVDLQGSKISVYGPDSGGFFRVTWKSDRETIIAHVVVESPGFITFDGQCSLDAKSPCGIRLNKAD
jgi:predicted acylesterase/phospholipase RssA